MKAIDVRTANWNEIMSCMSVARQRVYEAWQRNGPGTTVAVCERSMMSILSFRPRTTELVQLGLLECTGKEVSDGISHGIYSALSLEEVKHACENRKHSVQAQGMLL